MTPTETHPTIDYAFLESVTAELERTLEQTAALEADLENVEDAAAVTWQDSFNVLTRNLIGWQDRLEGLARQTSEAEADLHQHEQALRDWFKAVHLNHEQLASFII